MDAHRGIMSSPGRGFICPTTVTEDTMSALAMTRSLPILSGCSLNLNHTSVLPRFGKEGYSLPCALPIKPRSQSDTQGFKTRKKIWLLTWPLSSVPQQLLANCEILSTKAAGLRKLRGNQNHPLKPTWCFYGWDRFQTTGLSTICLVNSLEDQRERT